MGNYQSQHQYDSRDESRSPCESIEYPGLGTVKVYETMKKSYMQMRFIKTQQHQSIWAQSLKKIKNKNPSHLLLPINYSNQAEGLKGLLGSSSILINYEPYPYLLSSEISHRRQRKVDFRQTQLWLLLHYLLHAHQQMQALNLQPYGSIQPNHIFLNKQGHLKVANSLSWPDTRIQTYKFTDSKFSYFAPEILNNISAQLQRNQTRLSDSFSIGLTMLSAINLQNYEYLYSSTSHGKASFNEREFIKVMNQLMKNSKYSEILRATICCLLELNQQQRISGSEVEKWLQKYRVSILQKQDFVITDPPTQVVRQIQLIRSLVQYSIVL